MKVYKGLNSKTKGTYYNEDGVLFKDGKLTDTGKKLFGKDAKRAELNMKNGNVYQGLWRADTDTFDFATGKAKKGYEGKYRKEANGRWSFKDQSGWTYFNTSGKAHKQTVNKQTTQPKGGFVWDLNPDGGSYTRGKTVLEYGQIDDEQGLNDVGYNDAEDAYREAWLKVNPQAVNHGVWFWGHNPFKHDNTNQIKSQYQNQFKSDLNKWFRKYYAINPSQNKNVFNADRYYLRKTQVDGNSYVPLFTGNQYGFGVRKDIDEFGNNTYTDHNGNTIPGFKMINGNPYIKAETTNYYKIGGVLKAANGLSYKQLFEQARAGVSVGRTPPTVRQGSFAGSRQYIKPQEQITQFKPWGFNGNGGQYVVSPITPGIRIPYRK